LIVQCLFEWAITIISAADINIQTVVTHYLLAR